MTTEEIQPEEMAYEMYPLPRVLGRGKVRLSVVLTEKQRKRLAREAMEMTEFIPGDLYIVMAERIIEDGEFVEEELHGVHSLAELVREDDDDDAIFDAFFPLFEMLKS